MISEEKNQILCLLFFVVVGNVRSEDIFKTVLTILELFSE